MKRVFGLSAALFAGLLAAGCATTTVERTTADALADAQKRTGVQAQWLTTDQQRAEARAEVDRLLEKPLSADDAVRIALIASPSLQAALSDNAVAQAAAVQAGRVANPTFTFERLVRGESVDIGRLLSFGLGDLLTWPLRANVSKAALEEARLRTVADVVRTASETRQAWVQAAAAQQAVAYFEDVRRAAEASAELARRMQAVGNYSKLQRAREQAFYADSVTQQARALQANIAARERLIRLLGLDRTQAARLQLPQRLPDLPAEPQPESAVTQQALDDRLDLQLARASLEAAARAQGFTRTASWVDGLHLGLARNSETGAPPQRGFELDVPLPLADAGDARRAAANAAVLARLHRADQIAVDARSQVAEAYHAYRTAYDIARHYRDEIVPLRRTIADENLLRYNGMLIGVFELLADAREQIASVIAAIETQRDFWLADAALRAAQIGTPVAGVTMQPTASAGSAGAGGH